MVRVCSFFEGVVVLSSALTGIYAGWHKALRRNKGFWQVGTVRVYNYLDLLNPTFL